MLHLKDPWPTVKYSRDGSEAKRTDFSSRGPGFSSHHPHAGTQSSRTIVAEF